ncbi:sucrase ferredoxin [Devosia sp. 2618]|uniref:sucrase ferredoxin n=1 Tax=Devosia sp. 2618 TaxID=3156454 RepID=UPI003396576F
MSKHVFCRTLTLERGEPHEGTGEISPRFLMLAWPKGKWRAPRFESVDMSPALGEAVRAAMQSELTDNMVELVEGSPGQVLPTLFGYPEGRFIAQANEAQTIALIDAWTAGEPLPGVVDDRITILCCTDAKRDACCARFGFATFKALVAAADPARFNILQCTHLGGCRFAASLIVLPQGQRYGRLAPDEVPAFLTALENSEIYLPASRGNPKLDEPAQAAELAVMRWGAARGASQASVHIDARNEIDEDHMVFSGTAGEHRVSVRVATQIFAIDGACDSIGAEPPDMEKRWLAGQVEVI